MLDDSTHEALLISPYFIPGENGVRYLGGLAGRGVTVKVLTNALAATDEPEVHAGYSRYRIPLLEAGVDLFELRPLPGKPPRGSYGTSSGESLHAKSMIVDARHGVRRFDESRSALAPAQHRDGRHRRQSRARRGAFALFRQRDRARERIPRRARCDRSPSAKPALRWIAVDDGKPVTFEHDPETSQWTRMRVSLMRTLPIEDQL